MATKVVMEALSPTMEEGRLVKWLKNEGDQVKNGETLAEVETDKAIMELVARGDGVLRKRLLPENEAAPVGQLIAVIAAADENIDALVAGAGGGAAAPAAATPAPADVVANASESAGASSIPRTAAQAQGEASTPPQEKTGTAPAAPDGGRPAVPAAPAPEAGNGGRTRSSPLARRLASESGLDLQAVQGSGPGGRIIKRDVEAAVASGPVARAGAPAQAGTGARFAGQDSRDVPLTQIRKTIARRLSESIGPIPTFYLTAEFDMERVAETRTAMAGLGDEFKVSFNDIVLKAVATALAQHPEVNAHWLGECFVFDNRVTVNHALEKGAYDQCHACRMPISAADKQHEHYKKGISCHHCHGQKKPEQMDRYREREKQVELAKKRGEPHIGADSDLLKSQRRPLKYRAVIKKQT